MQLIAIARIVENDNLIGLVMLDKDTNEVKGVTEQSIVLALMGNKVSIENIGLNSGRLIGTNGSIDRLPCVDKHMKLVGKSPLVILNTIDDLGYTVSDYKGTVINLQTSNAIAYAKQNGISNGKIVTKDNKEFISSINGTYDNIPFNIMQERMTKKDKTKSNKNSIYTGELEDDIEPLPSVARVVSIYRSRGDRNKNVIIRYNKEKQKCVMEDTGFLATSTPFNKIIKGLVYKNSTRVICGKIYNEPRINNTEDIPLIEQMIRLKPVRENIDEQIAKMAEAFPQARIDSTTGIVASTKGRSYDPIVQQLDMDPSKNNFEDISIEEMFRYKNILRAMNCRTILYVQLDTKFMALSRLCSKSGIDYQVIDTRHMGGFIRVKVEDIIRDHSKYDNVIMLDDKNFTIVGLDGAYTYNIDKLYEQYHRNIVKTSTAIKAGLVDPSYREEIEQTGKLLELGTERSIIKIPSSVTEIGRKSIEVKKENEMIIIPEGVKKSSALAFYTRSGWSAAGIKIIINCNSKAGVAIVKSAIDLSRRRSSKLIFNRDISPEEFSYLIDSRNINYEAHNMNEIDDDFMVKAFNSYVKLQMRETLRKLNGDIRKLNREAMYSIWDTIEYVKRTWTNYLDKNGFDIAIEVVKEKIEDLFELCRDKGIGYR